MILNRSRRPVFVLLFGALALQSCSWMEGDCILIGVYAVTAYVTDASTRGIPASTPTLILVDGAYREDVSTPFPRDNSLSYAGGTERPGRYEVTVRANGYQDYVRSDVVVGRGGKCNTLQGVRLDVALTRAN